MPRFIFMIFIFALLGCNYQTGAVFVGDSTMQESETAISSTLQRQRFGPYFLPINTAVGGATFCEHIVAWESRLSSLYSMVQPSAFPIAFVRVGTNDSLQAPLLEPVSGASLVPMDQIRTQGPDCLRRFLRSFPASVRRIYWSVPTSRYGTEVGAARNEVRRLIQTAPRIDPRVVLVDDDAFFDADPSRLDTSEKPTVHLSAAGEQAYADFVFATLRKETGR